LHAACRGNNRLAFKLSPGHSHVIHAQVPAFRLSPGILDGETLRPLWTKGLRFATAHGLLPTDQQVIVLNIMPQRTGSYFHLHLVSDATGETLTTVARAATAQYTKILPVEHVYPLVRTQKQLDRVLAEIEESPGIVLYTLLDEELLQRLEKHCRELGLPCLSILGPVLQLLQSYLGAETSHRVGAQHVLNAEYFKRIDALNFTMLHDDGQHLDGLEQADVVLVGVSRTSKTPTSIYLANRGVKTGNVPLVPGMAISRHVEELAHPLVVGLYASPERIVQIRQNRLLGLKAHHDGDQYIDRKAVAEEVAFSRKLCARHNWPSIDVTRRSIEETAAAVLSLLAGRRRQPLQ
jgi:[pyruvate, water dikinase]-phosphate phosphotransferase / [pyruvate, water dikinase] kinase